MGRIIKKKDPGKKKEQRLARSEEETSTAQEGNAAAVSKPSPVVKKSIPLIKPKATQEPNLVQKSAQFLREVKIELKKVTWPSRKQAMGSTVVVIILVMVISVFLGVVDFGLSSLVRVVLP